jgi:hypothetical protein
MDVHQFPGAVPESGGNGGPAVPVVIGSGIVRRYVTEPCNRSGRSNRRAAAPVEAARPPSPRGADAGFVNGRPVEPGPRRRLGTRARTSTQSAVENLQTPHIASATDSPQTSSCAGISAC